MWGSREPGASLPAPIVPVILPIQITCTTRDLKFTRPNAHLEGLGLTLALIPERFLQQDQNAGMFPMPTDHLEKRT